nr:hypothetical protein Q903MT_gene6421 [Picea sitchensis]
MYALALPILDLLLTPRTYLPYNHTITLSKPPFPLMLTKHCHCLLIDATLVQATLPTDAYLTITS